MSTSMEELKVAIQAWDLGAVKSLVESGSVDVNAGECAYFSYGPWTPLQIAAVSAFGRTFDDSLGEIVHALLQAGADPNIATGRCNETPLQLAIGLGHSPPLFRMFLDHSNANVVNLPDRNGATPMHDACFVGNTQIISLLLNAGADPRTVNDYGQSPFFWACINNDIEPARVLLDSEFGPEILASVDADGRSPLHDACYHNRPEFVREVLSRGADPFVRDNNGKTPYDIVATSDSIDFSEDEQNVIGNILLSHFRDQLVEREGRASLLTFLRGATYFRRGQDNEEQESSLPHEEDSSDEEQEGLLTEREDDNSIDGVNEEQEDVMEQQEVWDDDSDEEQEDLLLHPIGNIKMSKALRFIGSWDTAVLEPDGAREDDNRDLGQEDFPTEIVAMKEGLRFLFSFETEAHEREYVHEASVLALVRNVLEYLGAFTGQAHPADEIDLADAISFVRVLLAGGNESMILARDEVTGEIPLHVASATDAPVALLSLLVGQTGAAFLAPDHSGGLPIHSACRAGASLDTIQFLVEHGGVGTLCVRDNNGALPLHLLSASSVAPLDVVKYLLKEYPKALQMTNKGTLGLPMMIAAESDAPLSVVYALITAHCEFFVPFLNAMFAGAGSQKKRKRE